MSDDYKNPLLDTYQGHAMDILLGSKKVSSMNLPSFSIASNFLASIPKAGTRVAFADTVEALLTYPRMPSSDGTVVSVKTAFGCTTTQDGYVHVLWDDGGLIPVHRDHLKPPTRNNSRTASNHCIVVSSLGDLSGFLKGAVEGELVNKSSKDLWSYRVEDGQYVIERLFDTDGSPLKGV